MSGKTNLSATLFSQKKLLGKTSTGTHRADSNEPIPSGLQVSSQAVFSEDIPTSPSRTLFTVQGPGGGKPNTVEYVEFKLQSITGSTYDANDFDSEASGQISGPHAYRMVLSESYQANSDNSKSGVYPYVDNQILHWTIGGLQLVSPGFSNDVPNPYTLKLYESDGTEIPLLDEIDWQVDYFSGIVFVQDYDSSKIPENAKAFIYTGKMLSQSLGEAGSGGGGGSGGASDIGWFGSGNGSISTTGSVYFGTQNTSNPEIFFSSVGAATFNEQGRNSDFRVEAVGKESAFKVDADTQQVLILSGGASISEDEASGADTAFYVSGSIDSKGTSERGTSVFGGDLVVSGALALNQGAAEGSHVHITTEGKVGIGTSTPTYKLSVGGSMEVGEYIYHRNDANTFIRFQDDDINIQAGGRSMLKMREDPSIDQVLVMSGNGASTSPDPKDFLDTNFFVSGAVGSRGTLNSGTSVFGGDVFISGTLYDSAGEEISGAGNVSFNGGNGSNNQMITADGSGGIVAESNITFNGTQLDVSGDILPGSDNTYDLGAPNARFANIYTGDLHLQNERGHWQIIEEAEALTVINRLTNKRYKIVLEPYEEE